MLYALIYLQIKSQCFAHFSEKPEAACPTRKVTRLGLKGTLQSSATDLLLNHLGQVLSSLCASHSFCFLLTPGQKILFQHELDLLLTQNKSEMLQEWAADFLISPQTAASWQHSMCPKHRSAPCSKPHRFLCRDTGVKQIRYLKRPLQEAESFAFWCTGTF